MVSRTRKIVSYVLLAVLLLSGPPVIFLAWRIRDFDLGRAVAERDVISAVAMMVLKPDLVNPRDGRRLAPLHIAVTKGDLNMTKLLLSYGARIDATALNSITPLHIAVGGGSKGIAEFLIEKGADVGRRDTDGRNPLMYASAKGDTEMMAILTKAGADVNSTDIEGWTPLMLAVAAGELRAAEKLLKLGANVEAMNKTGEFPLYVAVGNGQTDMAGLLLKHGAAIDRKYDSKETNNIEDETALIAAASWGNKEMVSFLIDHGADMEARDHEGSTPLIAALHWREMKSIVLSKAYGRYSTLNREPKKVKQLKKEAVEVLIAKGADVNAEDAVGFSVLQHALLSENTAAADILKAHGAHE